MKLGWAIGRVLAKNGKGPVLIGKDTRLSGYMFESALEAGLSASGVDIQLVGPMPTPGIAFLTQNTRAQAGIVISASHNPFQDNGIKLFAANGMKLPDETEIAIEAELEKPFEILNPAKLGKAVRINDAPRRYIEFCKSHFDPSCDLGGLSIVIDCAHGATYHIAPIIFEELGAKVETIGAEPDGLNINEACGSTKPEKLQQMVVARQADLGIALDGDGDRLIMVDHTGAVVDGDELLYIIAKSKFDSLNGGVVGTQMSNLGLEHAICELGLNFHRASVGDRYVMEQLLAKDLRLGGESSGHIINLNLSPTGDGIISAIQVVQALAESGGSLSEQKRPVRKYPQKLVNVKIPGMIDLKRIPQISDLVRDAENELGNEGRVLLRPSGTEPLVRVMVEGIDETRVSTLVHTLADSVENILQNHTNID